MENILKVMSCVLSFCAAGVFSFYVVIYPVDFIVIGGYSISSTRLVFAFIALAFGAFFLMPSFYVEK